MKNLSRPPGRRERAGAPALAGLARCGAAALCLGLATAAAAPVAYTDEASYAAATTTAVLESFDHAPWNADTTYAGSVASQGLTWSAASGLRASTFAAHGGAVSLSDSDGVPDVLDMLQAQGAGSYSAFGLWLRSGGLRTDLAIELLDAQGALLATCSQWIFGGWAFIGLTDDTGFAGVRLRALADGNGFTDDFFVDDVRFGALAPPAQPVPEPASAALAALALGAAAWARRCI